MNKIKSKDTVIVLTGKSKGHVGLVKRVKNDRVWVEGANLLTKHVKANPQAEKKGGIVTEEASIHVSNVALYNSVTGKADKVGFRFEERQGKNTKVRYFRSNNELIDIAK